MTKQKRFESLKAAILARHPRCPFGHPANEVAIREDLAAFEMSLAYSKNRAAVAIARENGKKGGRPNKYAAKETP